jgi:hypothetical protein
MDEMDIQRRIEENNMRSHKRDLLNPDEDEGDDDRITPGKK